MPQAYTYHQRSCLKTKKRLSDALAKARAWRVNKRQKIEEMGQSQTVEYSLNQDTATDVATPIVGCKALDHSLAVRRGECSAASSSSQQVVGCTQPEPDTIELLVPAQVRFHGHLALSCAKGSHFP